LNSDIVKINWGDIYGQHTAKEILSELLRSSRIPHALLFTGQEGIGKFFLSIRFAQLTAELTSDNPSFITRQIANLSEPYIKYIIPLPRGKNETDNNGPIEKLTPEDILEMKLQLEKKILNPYHKITISRANTIKINSIRDIGKFLSLNYSDIKYRFIIISDAHLMNEASQNALLKNLEEPPEGVIFILLTPYPALLRETILSRCWKINLQPLADYDVLRILKQFYNIDEKTAADVAPFSEGSVTRATELIENDFEDLKEKTITFMRYSFGGKFHSALNELSPFLSESDSDSVRLLIKMIIAWLNDIIKYRIKSGDFYFSTHIDTLKKFNSRFPDIELNDTIVKLDTLSGSVRNNINLNLICRNLIYELASLTGKLKK